VYTSSVCTLGANARYLQLNSQQGVEALQREREGLRQEIESLRRALESLQQESDRQCQADLLNFWNRIEENESLIDSLQKACNRMQSESLNHQQIQTEFDNLRAKTEDDELIIQSLQKEGRNWRHCCARTHVYLDLHGPWY